MKIKRLVLRSIFLGAIATIASLIFLLIIFWFENFYQYDGFLSIVSRLLNCPGFLVVWFGTFPENIEYFVFGVVNWLCWTVILLLILILTRHLRYKDPI